MKAAVYAGTRNLYYDMIPGVKSLLAHSNVDKVYLLIEDDEFPFTIPDRVECINVSDQPYFRHDGPNFKNGWTYMVLMRAALHRVFPELDRVLSLDVDTIVTEDISELWDLDLSQHYLAGVREPQKSNRSLYINAGVMMLNLKRLRGGKGDEIIEALNTRHFPWNEQDCINELCAGEILEIPGDYNSSNWTARGKTQKIIHYAANPRWQTVPLVLEWRDKEWIFAD